jgi:ribonuclease BN (tRNA processing enzyme)
LPRVDRSEPANLLVAGDQLVLVDTGDGTADQLAKINLSVAAIGSVFISHHHMDHTGGLGAVIGIRWMLGSVGMLPPPLTIYGPPGTQEMVNGIVASMQPQARVGMGGSEKPLAPAGSVKVVEIRGGETVRLGDLVVVAARNSHLDYPEPHEPQTAQSLSYRFNLGNRSITYTGDTGPSEAVSNLAKETDLLVSEVTDLDSVLALLARFGQNALPGGMAAQRYHFEMQHLTPENVGLIAEAARAKHLVLTHFAFPGAVSDEELKLRGGIAKAYRGPVDLARDLSSFDVACD